MLYIENYEFFFLVYFVLGRLNDFVVFGLRSFIYWILEFIVFSR